MNNEVTIDFLQEFAEAWNRHDIDALMACMADGQKHNACLALQVLDRQGAAPLGEVAPRHILGNVCPPRCLCPARNRLRHCPRPCYPLDL